MSATTSSFEAWPHNHVQGEPIDTLGVPFDDKFFTENFEAVIGAIEEDETAVYRSPGVTHARSYEMVPGRSEGLDETGVWFDRYGNPYTSLSTKGNNFTRQEIFSSGTAPSGYIPFGLQESDALLRVVKASRILRQAGIDTEWIVRVIEPKQLQFDQERVDQETFKRRLLNRVISEAGVAVDLEDSKPQRNADEVAKISAALSGMSFFVTLRAMSISDRPNDFMKEDAQAATSRLSHVFDVINALETGSREGMSVANPDHVQQYFTSFLPCKLASNLAKLHNLGLAHTHPYTGNVNLLGGLVDLDSIKGEVLNLGDEATTVKNFISDIEELLSHPFDNNMSGVFRHARTIGLLPSAEDSFQDFLSTFYDQYFCQRNLDPSNFDQAMELLKMVSQLSDITLTEKVKQIIELSLDNVTNDKVDPRKILKLADLIQSITPELVYDVAKTLEITHASSPDLRYQDNLRSISFEELRAERDLLIFAIISDSVMSTTDNQAGNLAEEWELTAEAAQTIVYAYGLLLVAQVKNAYYADEKLQKTVDETLSSYLAKALMSAEQAMASIRSIDVGGRTKESEFVTLNGQNMELKCGLSLFELFRCIDLNLKEFKFFEPSENVLDSYEEGEDLPTMIVSGQSIRALSQSKQELVNQPEPIPFGSLFVVTESGQIDYLAFIGKAKEKGKLNIKVQAKTEDIFPEIIGKATRETRMFKTLLRVRLGIK